MKVKLTNRILDEVKTAAHRMYIDKSGMQIDPGCLHVYHIIKAFCEHVNRTFEEPIETEFEYRQLGPR